MSQEKQLENNIDGFTQLQNVYTEMKQVLEKFQKAIQQVKQVQKKIKKTKKDKRDPNEPKKNLGAFFLYVQSRREKVKSENPNAEVTDISKIIGKEWREMPEENKNIWKKKEAKALQKYKNDLEKYRDSLLQDKQIKKEIDESSHKKEEDKKDKKDKKEKKEKKQKNKKDKKEKKEKKDSRELEDSQSESVHKKKIKKD